MSGGAFEYHDTQLKYLAELVHDEIVSALKMAKDPEYKGYYHMSKEFLNKVKLLYGMLLSAYVLCHRADWVISGDDGEEDFEPRLKEDLKELKEELGISLDVKFTDNEVTVKVKKHPKYNEKIGCDD